MKFKKVFMTIILSLVIVVTFSKNIVSIATTESIENHNKEILGKVETLQNLAKEYIEEKSITGNTATNLCMQYIRKDRYNSGLWNTLLGNIDSEFLTYLEGKQNVPTFENEVLIDPNTGKEIDFVHMIAPLNAYLKNGDKVMYFVSTDYAGWAGDLITLLEEVTVYRTENNIEEKDKMQEYSNSLLGTNNPSTFSSSDVLADLDAVALYKDGTNNKITEDLYTALYKYYVSKDGTYNASNRLESVQTILGNTIDVVKAKAKTLLTNTSFGSIDIKSSLFQDSTNATLVTSDDIDVVSQSFANYVYGVPYLKLQSINGEGTVGQEDIKVKIIESNANLKNENIEIENNIIAKAEIDDEYLKITPLNGGKTKITVYSKDKTVSSVYELTSKNVAPTITKNLDTTYELTKDVEKIISVEAEGTNNIYTWYIQNETNGTFNKVAETEENTYKILPTLEMNNTYIKCGVKNDGNDEVFSNIAKITVIDNEENDDNNQDNELEEDNNINQDNTLEEEDNNINENTMLEENNTSNSEKPTVLPTTGDENGILLFIPIILVAIVIVHKKVKEYKEM